MAPATIWSNNYIQYELFLYCCLCINKTDGREIATFIPVHSLWLVNMKTQTCACKYKHFHDQNFHDYYTIQETTTVRLPRNTF